MNKPDPKNPIRFFDVHSKLEDKRFSGVFHLRKISVFGFSQIHTTKLKLSQGLGSAGLAHDLLLEKMALLDYMIVKADQGAEKWYFVGEPERTWKDIHDLEILNALHEEVKAFDDFFRGRRPAGEDQPDQEEGSGEHGQRSEVHDPLVGEDLQKKPERRRVTKVDFK